jgi:hypothetical protein
MDKPPAPLPTGMSGFLLLLVVGVAGVHGGSRHKCEVLTSSSNIRFQA